MKKALIGAAIVVAVVAGGVLLLSKEKKSGPKFRKEKVTKGAVVATVTATGTLSAVTTVKVGSQVSGIISRLHADFNSEVRKGQLLAELDPTPFQATVDQRRADLERAKVELRNTELVLARAKKLLEAQLQAQSEFDTAKANRDGAAASVEQSAAALKQAETNLAYTRILSPIDGVVVDRQYDIGQTVAASFQAPALFTIAQDLTKMQVLDEHRRGRHRPREGGSGGELLRRRLPRPAVRRAGLADPALAADGPERRHLPGPPRRRQPRAEAAARDDRERLRAGRPPGRRPAGPERGPPLPARPGRPRGRREEGREGGREGGGEAADAAAGAPRRRGPPAAGRERGARRRRARGAAATAAGARAPVSPAVRGRAGPGPRARRTSTSRLPTGSSRRST